ncbi:hypothetical protein ACTXI9_01440 [Brachybacterium alimentarium]|uniref:hypothetical protein n=1 Tax=Brachybacterium alimentarium TaxID=47845 RepID=UPI003FD57815
MPDSIVEIARQANGDLASLDWEPTEEPHSPQITIAVALRYGEMTSAGIAFPAGQLSAAERPERLARLFGDTQRAEAQLVEHDKLMEAIIPGWIESGRRLSEDLEKSTAESVAKAQQRADEVLSAPVLPHLASSWERMGGILDPR